MNLQRPRDVLGEFGLYVHVPFCSHRCWYCDFNAYAGLDHLAASYMEALAQDVRLAVSAPDGADLTPRPTVTSVFIGGGTPSLVPAASVVGVLEAIREAWPLDPGAEITIECNPESLDAAKLETYAKAGINRVSIGVQSLDPGLLHTLGRTHSPETALEAVRMAVAGGFQVNADLMFGTPGETDESWRASLDGVLEREPSHVSCYGLTYEEGTPLESFRKLGRITPVPDDEVGRRWEKADSLLGSAGFERYEISNWARTGCRSRHNSLYWAGGEYLGLGAGAHSHMAAGGSSVRSWTLKAPQRYIDAVNQGRSTVAGAERIDVRTRATELMMLGLRRTEGVSYSEFASLAGDGLADVFGAEVEEGVRRGLLSSDADRIRLDRPLLGNEAVLLFV